MKLAGTISLFLFSFLALAAKKPSASTFDTFYSRSLSSTPISIDDEGFEELAATPRDFSVAVLLTALEAKFGCKLCRDFQSEWDVLARSWQKGDKKGEGRTLFTTLDLSNGRATFMKVQL